MKSEKYYLQKAEEYIKKEYGEEYTINREVSSFFPDFFILFFDREDRQSFRPIGLGPTIFCKKTECFYKYGSNWYPVTPWMDFIENKMGKFEGLHIPELDVNKEYSLVIKEINDMPLFRQYFMLVQAFWVHPYLNDDWKHLLNEVDYNSYSKLLQERLSNLPTVFDIVTTSSIPHFIAINSKEKFCVAEVEEHAHKFKRNEDLSMLTEYYDGPSIHAAEDDR